jgi:hypothetical protein
MPLGLTNALVIFQSCNQLQRHLLLFDALMVYSRTGEYHWNQLYSQLDETRGIVAMTEVFHLDHVISVDFSLGWAQA